MFISRLAATLRRLRHDRRGNVLMLFALSLVPLTFATGAAIDYGAAMRLQTKVNAVADAAALSAVTTPMMKRSMLDACNVSRRMFTYQVGTLPRLNLATSDMSKLRITVTDTFATLAPVTITCPVVTTGLVVPAPLSLSRVITVSYDATSSNTFGGAIGYTVLNIGGTASARTVLAPYIDIHLALDTSQSMGLAATDKAAQDLWQATAYFNGRSCQFGCHERSPSEPYSNEFIANVFKIPLRVNILRDATLDMIDTAINGQGTAQNFRFGLYRIGREVTEYVPLTTDLATVRAKVSTLTLGPNDGAVGFGDTDLPEATTTIMSKIVANGDGTTQAKARAFFFLVTDGVTDLAGPCTYGHCTSPIDPATCAQYKNAGITVGVVYTTYLPTKANPMNPADPSLRDEYVQLIQPIAANIAPRLEACASPGWFFQAASATDIHAAMQKLFSQATQTPIITH